MSSMAQIDDRRHDHAREPLDPLLLEDPGSNGKGSGKSELYGIARTSTDGVGMVTLLGDFGLKDATVSIGIEATAAMGIAQRVGLNNVCHVVVDILWIH
jgi:hypothetical protein